MSNKTVLFLLLPIYSMLMPLALALDPPDRNYSLPEVDDIYEPVVGYEVESLAWDEVAANKTAKIYNYLNFGHRPWLVDEHGDLLPAVINAIVMGTCSFYPDIIKNKGCARFYNYFEETGERDLGVNYIVFENGKVEQVVHPKWRPWATGWSREHEPYYVHDGKMCDPGECQSQESRSFNDYSVTIWLEHDSDQSAYTEAQVNTLARLIAFFIKSEDYEVVPSRVYGYEEVRYNRKRYEMDGLALHDQGESEHPLPWLDLHERGVVPLPMVDSTVGDDKALLSCSKLNNQWYCSLPSDQVDCLQHQFQYLYYYTGEGKNAKASVHSLIPVFQRRYNPSEYSARLQAKKTQGVQPNNVFFTQREWRLLKALLRQKKPQPPQEIMNCDMLQHNAQRG